MPHLGPITFQSASLLFTNVPFPDTRPSHFDVEFISGIVVNKAFT